MERRHQGLLEKEPQQEAEEDTGSEVNFDNSITEEEREEMNNQLTKLEEEIFMLKQVLASKERRHAELKHRLGITALGELRQNLGRSWTDVQSNTVYKKTSETLNTAGQKTTAAISTLGSALSRKLGDVRNSSSFRSFEEKVENTVSNIKSKVGGTPGGGSFEDVLSSAAQASAHHNDQTTTNTNIPEKSSPRLSPDSTSLQT
ncbi:tumor protein D53 [Trichomycterus rosablanca]|uniref:tumor protein D53 n=1 Tax=Trichomycterus rosablanca TaxID=2290929 RepID=UPI002F34F6F1